MRLVNQLELLSPARDITIGKEAIIHGADAVYIGGMQFGARHNAGNSVCDIAQLVEFAHQYRVRIYVTLNTILHDHELEPARKLIHELYDAGVDALIVQDMGILKLDIPPIDLHASTQADIRTVTRAHFLSEVGFSQLVLARELSLAEIELIHDTVEADLEFFIHGALCVAFSGQCYLSHAQTGRSANRGDCSQACRLPYTLKDQSGGVISFEKHLLSMKDNNQSRNIRALIKAGIRSFKIEGRYKDLSYVKNITAHYRRLLDEVLTEQPEFQRASLGRAEHFFTPDPQKTFHRGMTEYFVHGRGADIGAFDSPKYTGVEIGKVIRLEGHHLEVASDESLANGDGLNVLIKREVVGFRANTVTRTQAQHYLIELNEVPEALTRVRQNQPLYRNLDMQWQKQIAKHSAARRLALELVLTMAGTQLVLWLYGEGGITHCFKIDHTFDIANNAEKAYTNLKEGLSKLGETVFFCQRCTIDLTVLPFIPVSQINQIRRDAITALQQQYQQSYMRPLRKNEKVPPPVYPDQSLSYLGNIYNHKAREFYHDHGVTLIASAYEANETHTAVPLMITKHCLRHAFNLCPKQAKGVLGVQGQVRAEPLTLVHNQETLRLEFKCRPCEMLVYGRIKPHIAAAPLAGSET